MVPAPTTTTRFNSPMRVSMPEFEELVQKAIESIPKQFLPYLENTMFIVEESSPRGLMGLYKRSHERAATTMNDLVEEIRRTILHEVGHHFGKDEDDLPY